MTIVKQFKIEFCKNSTKIIDVKSADLFYANDHKYVGKYQGSVFSCYPHGAGNIIFINNDEYFGQFINGIINGRGIFVESGGCRYEGNFMDGKKHGIGKMNYPNGDKYEGEWEDNLRSGHGVLYYVNGDKFEGEWVSDLRNGKGKLTRIDGDIFEGQWLDNNWYDSNKPDPLFEEAARIIVIHQQGSTSLIQRKLGINYSRAGRIIDQIEAAGIIGPFEGTKARDVLIPDLVSLKAILDFEVISKAEDNHSKGEIIKKRNGFIGNWKWNNHPGHIIEIKADTVRNNFYKGFCVKIGDEKFYTSNQIMMDNVELDKASIIKGKVLVPFGAGNDPGFKQKWFDFEGVLIEKSFNIIIGPSKWNWTFQEYKGTI